ncbi:MAG: YbaB/EbfC family nucleoid-associated protein [Planctomycetota bacterium]|nr:YbaB/EbfC family nucleoid-associated protein [Planctomycetota bacterium]
MFKGLGNIAQMFKQAQQLQGKMSEVQEGLGQLRVEGQAGGSMVCVTANGQQRIVAVKIEDSLLKSGDREMIEDLLVAATNQALERAREAAAQAMTEVTSEMPGLNEAMSKFAAEDDSIDV